MSDLNKTDCPKCSVDYGKLEGNFYPNKSVPRKFQYICINCSSIASKKAADERAVVRIRAKNKQRESEKRKAILTDEQAEKQLNAAHNIAYKSRVIETNSWKDLKKCIDYS